MCCVSVKSFWVQIATRIVYGLVNRLNIAHHIRIDGDEVLLLMLGRWRIVLG